MDSHDIPVGSTYLITGGAGFFGNAYVRRLLNSDAQKVIVFSRDWHKHAVMKAEVSDDRVRYINGDVCDYQSLLHAFRDVDIIIHAAAYKSVNLGEYSPQEVVRVNVVGSINVINAAIERGVKKVVALSSDKACNPVNTYGRSKSLMESVITQANVYSHKTRFACCRYGNVFGSSGSVIPLWEEQLAKTGKIQITDPTMTRFFMTVSDACVLVEDAIRDMVGGEIFVPKAHSMRMINLANAWRLGALVEIIGIRPGEKMHEELISANESYRALEQSQRFVILPAAREWVSENIQGLPLAAGTHYASDDHPLPVEEIRGWLDDSR